jgi:hypothetical protein
VIQQEKIGDIQQVLGYFTILYEWNKKLSGCNDWNYSLCHFQNIRPGSIVLPKRQNYGFSYNFFNSRLNDDRQGEGGTLTVIKVNVTTRHC